MTINQRTKLFTVSLFFILPLVFLLVQCATPYQALGPLGGYSDVELEDGRYEVTFRGNPNVGQAQVKEYTLLRCAELALELGYPYFIIWADSSYLEEDVNLATREQPWKEGSSAINQATANPETSIDTRQVWSIGRFIISFYKEIDPMHAFATMNAQEVVERNKDVKRK